MCGEYYLTKWIRIGIFAKAIQPCFAHSATLDVAISSGSFISRHAMADFTRNSIVNPPCRSSCVDEFINIGVYTFIPYTTRGGITAFDRNSLHLIGWSLEAVRLHYKLHASYTRGLCLWNVIRLSSRLFIGRRKNVISRGRISARR